MFLRDTRTLAWSVFLPVLLMPLLFRMVLGVKQHKEDSQQKLVYSYITAGPYANDVRQLLNATGAFKEFGIAERPTQHLREGFLDLQIDTYSDQHPLDEVKPTHSQEHKQEVLKGAIFGERAAGRPGLRVTYVDRERSGLAKNKLYELLSQTKRDYRDKKLRWVGFDPKDFLQTEYRDIATEQSRAGSNLAPVLPLLLVFLILGGASVAAVDCVAGERERGTLETLLTSCLPQSSIIAAKQMAVISLSLFITFFQMANMLFYIHLGWIRADDFLNVQLTPATCATLILLAGVLAVTISSLLLFVSASSQNFKEAQLALFPALIVCISLTAAGTLPELRLSSAVAIVPLAGISVAIREQLCAQTSWIGLTTCILVHLAVAGGLLWASRKRLVPQGEFSSDERHSLTEQKRGYLRAELPWVYALAVAAILTVPSNFPVLITLAGQVFFNQGLMLLIAVGLLVRQGIPLKDGLRVRPIGWKILLACCFLAPLVQLVAQSTVWATGEFFPMPEEMLKQMSRMILPDDAPTWKLVLLIALSPAVCEEIAFRGALLYSLCKGGEERLSTRRKISISLVVGLAFGASHLMLAKLLSTAVIGFFLTLLALETGSILPGMLVHFGNNAMAVLAERNHIELGNMPVWVWGASWFGIFLIFLWLRKGAAKGTRASVAKFA